MSIVPPELSGTLETSGPVNGFLVTLTALESGDCSVCPDSVENDHLPIEVTSMPLGTAPRKGP